MSRAPVPPSLGAESFSCAHCGALAHQNWFRIIPDTFRNGKVPKVFTPAILVAIEDNVEKKHEEDDLDDRELDAMRSFFQRFAKNDVTYLINRNSSNSQWEMVNAYLSQCHSCKGFTIWVKDAIVFPSHDVAILPHEDMPDDVKVDFVEAGEIVDKSPRGAAALLRLAIQKLMKHLGENDGDLNASIASLVKGGLDKKVQQALDIVRVTGNNAVHPGVLDLKDDRTTATQLFALVNIIVQSTISAKAQIETMYLALPEGALRAIEKRDS